MQVKVSHWNESSQGPLTEAAMRRCLEAEGYTVATYRYPPGTYFPPHTHAVSKKDAVLSGRLKISWEGGSAVLGAGDAIEIPAGFRHSAEVLGYEPVLSIDATRDW